MVRPEQVARIVADAAYAIRRGELVVFGSGALAYGLKDAPRVVDFPEIPNVRAFVPHPHDILLAKLERLADKDREHIELILREHPLALETYRARLDEMPHRTGAIGDPLRRDAFEQNAKTVERWIVSGP